MYGFLVAGSLGNQFVNEANEGNLAWLSTDSQPVLRPSTAREACFVVRDRDGRQLAYIYFENEPGCQAAQQRRGAADRG
jgi:hypothetical protein